MIKQLKVVLSTTGQLFCNTSLFCTVNSKNPLLLFGTCAVEWSDTVEVPFSDAQKIFFVYSTTFNCNSLATGWSCLLIMQ